MADIRDPEWAERMIDRWQPGASKPERCPACGWETQGCVCVRRAQGEECPCGALGPCANPRCHVRTGNLPGDGASKPEPHPEARLAEIKAWLPAIPDRIVAYQKGEPTPILTMLSIAHDYLVELVGRLEQAEKDAESAEEEGDELARRLEQAERQLLGVQIQRNEAWRRLEQLEEAIASALTSLGTGPMKDGYAYAVLSEALGVPPAEGLSS
jgi:hypothetical protein